MGTDTTKIVAARINAAKGKVTDVELSRETGIPRSTLQAKLKTGDLTIRQLDAVSEFFGVKPESWLRDIPTDAA